MTIRDKLATMLRDELVRMGLSFVYFDGDNLIPVSGYWKSQDVYRWESAGLQMIHNATGSHMAMSISGWEPMTTIVRAGKLTITNTGVYGQYEADSA